MDTYLFDKGLYFGSDLTLTTTFAAIGYIPSTVCVSVGISS